MSSAGHLVLDALVLRTIPFGETSEVVHLSTAEHGLVAALAKGAYRADGEHEGGITLFARGQAWLKAPRRGARDDDGLSLCSRWRLRDAHAGLARSLPRYLAACYVLELLRTWQRPALPLPALHGAGTTVLRALARATPEAVPGWVAWFEARAAAAAGHRPQLEACAACGAVLGGALDFSPPAGGIVHRACAPPGPRLSLAPASRRALERVYSERLAALVEEPLGPTALRALRHVHDVWIPWLLERQPAALATLPRA